MPAATQALTSTVEIGAPIDRVWEAITTPSIIKQWFLGVDTESDWPAAPRSCHAGRIKADPTSTRARAGRSSRLVASSMTHGGKGSVPPAAPEPSQGVPWTLTPHT